MYNNYDENKTKYKSTRESHNVLAKSADSYAHYVWPNMIKCVIHPPVLVETGGCGFHKTTKKISASE